MSRRYQRGRFQEASVIPIQPFGHTDHDCSRVIWGTAALFESRESESRHVLELL